MVIWHICNELCLGPKMYLTPLAIVGEYFLALACAKSRFQGNALRLLVFSLKFHKKKFSGFQRLWGENPMHECVMCKMYQCAFLLFNILNISNVTLKFLIEDSYI